MIAPSSIPTDVGQAAEAEGLFKTREKLLTRRGVLWLGQTCNIRCHFCYFLDRIESKEHVEHPFMELDKAKQICRDLRFRYGNTAIDIQGGEPTIWPHIYELCRYCADIGLHPTLITNGIALYRRDNVVRLQQAGVRDLLISVHALREVYDEIVGFKSGSDKQAQGIDNCISVGLPFRFNLVLSKKAIPQLEEIARLAVTKGARVVNFLAFNPFEDQANAGKRSSENVPRYGEVAPALNAALDILEANGIEANVRYYPICVVAPRHRKSIYNHQQLSFDPHEWDYNSWRWTGQQPQRMKWGPPSPHPNMLGTDKPGNARRSIFSLLRLGSALSRQEAQSSDELSREIAPYRDHARDVAKHHYRYPAPCASCDARDICDGFHGDYVEIFGADEAAPIKTGHRIDDPTYFVSAQVKLYEPEEAGRQWRQAEQFVEPG